MSKLLQYFLLFLIFVSFSKNINAKTVFWSLSYSNEIIELGDSGEAFLTIDLNKYPDQTIDFDNTVIIGFDLDKPDATFSAKIHKHNSTKDGEVYKIDFISETIGKNKFKITLYDYDNQKKYLLEEVVEFEIGKKEEIIEEIVPSPKSTKLLKSLADSYGENDTITVEFSLVDTKGKDIIGNSTFIKKLKVKNNGEESKDAIITYSEDGKTFNLTMKPEYLPLLQKINIEFNGDKKTFNLFKNDLETTIEVSPFYLNTEVNCNNCDNVSYNETPSIDFNLYNYKKVPVDTNDYSNTFEIVIDGPLDNEYNESNSFSVKKIDKDGNQYEIEYKEGDCFIHGGTYTIKVYEDGILIKEFTFLIEDLIPDPENTQILKPLSQSYGENDTISLEFTLADSNGNPIFGSSTFIKRFKVKNNGEDSKEATITYSEDGKTFYLTMKPEYLPLLQKINIEFNGENDTFNLFKDDLETTIILSPFYLNIEVNCDNCENISLNEVPLIDIKVYNYKKVPINFNDYSDSFRVLIEGPLDSEYYKALFYNVEKKNKDENMYQIVYKKNAGFTRSGTYVIKVYEKGLLIKELKYIIHPGFYDLNQFSLEFKDKDFKPEKAFVDTEYGMVLKGYDCFGNRVTLPLKDKIKIYLMNEKGRKIKYSTRFTENNDGELEIDIISETLGYAKLKLFLDGNEILKINKYQPLPAFIFNLMKCSSSNLYKDQLSSAIAGEEITFYLQCIDKFGNLVKRGGEQFTSDNYYISNGRYTSFPIKIKDLKNGNYSFNFIPTAEGYYTISIFLDDKLFEELSFEVSKLQCGGSTPFLCPNKNLCVSNRRKCIEPANNCPEEAPFLCKVNFFEKCVKSQTECDCPFGFVRCDYMKYCVPMDRLDMCPNFSHITQKSCQKLKQFNKLCRDGICRLTYDLSPTQKVCPIGKVLCADLSCRDSYYDCEVSDFCKGFRCPDQSCVSDYRDCPSTISCQNKKYVCPDGTCVDSEIECEPLPICPADKPFRCHDNLCVKNKYSCSKNVACGQRMALCKDLICRTNCNYF